MITPKDLKELTEAGLLSEEHAEQIVLYYKNKTKRPVVSQSTTLAYSIIGALLVGIGVIDLFAHNWDQFSKLLKVVLSLLPLLIGQVFCGIILFSKKDFSRWKEAASSFLFLAIGASIALVSQVYHMEGNLGSFFLWWIIPALPLLYLMRSYVSIMLYMVGALVVLFASFSEPQIFQYYLTGIALFGAVIPLLNITFRKREKSTLMKMTSWTLVISLLLVICRFIDFDSFLLPQFYLSLFAFFYHFGHRLENNIVVGTNSLYRGIGFIGTLLFLYGLTFDWFWADWGKTDVLFNELVGSYEFWVTIIFMGLSVWGMIRNKIFKTSFLQVSAISYSFILSLVILIIAKFIPIGKFLTWGLVLWIAVQMIIKGGKSMKEKESYWGFIILFFWVQGRLVDIKLSFVVKGVIFMILGVGFLLGNVWYNRKNHENNEA
ncbi:DUF2157 domain-containing protein [Halosquirtibacter laminarini]|uniref:DUF2157 domain-containing protein n=1 Tax=Halosquirtibacter laminarini TaxID=3374600 RepID=A0AC61NPT5_9BACT|nr:DUF2157 domain-containing protein [Prolixibacteraceae bacterium]